MSQQIMLTRVVSRRLAIAQSTRTRLPSLVQQRRWFTPAPKPGDGPLMSRRADRELPEINDVRFRWRRTLPIFLVIVATCSVAIFNYQKMSSPIVSSTLYALRTSSDARAVLGDEIYFKHQIPWIHGEMNQLHGRIDVWFSVRGSRGEGVMRFASHRPTSRGFFETTEWSLTTPDGQRLDLLDAGDPFKGLMPGGSAPDEEEEVALDKWAPEDAPTRGFRQQPKF